MPHGRLTIEPARRRLQRCHRLVLRAGVVRRAGCAAPRRGAI